MNRYGLDFDTVVKETRNKLIQPLEALTIYQWEKLGNNDWKKLKEISDVLE